jgi:hypothetical protein
VEVHDIAETGDSSFAAAWEEHTFTDKRRSSTGQSNRGTIGPWPPGPRRARKALAVLLQHAGHAAVPILAESSPVATTFRKHDEFSAQARPNPYGTQGCPDHCQATTGNHHRNMAPATRHRHHPAMPDCCCSRSAAARDRRDLTRSPWRGEWQAVTADIARAFGGSSKRRGCRSGRPSRHYVGEGVGRGERVSCFRASRQCSC